MAYVTDLSRLGPVVSGKRADRQDRSLNLLGHRDALIGPMLRGIIAQAKQSGIITEATIAYLTRKQHAVRADYYRLRYGRDYWTGRPRHSTRRAARRSAAWQEQEA